MELCHIWCYFEIDPAGFVTRQVEVYNKGPTQRYSTTLPTDLFGMLRNQPLNLVEFAEHEIRAADLESVWAV